MTSLFAALIAVALADSLPVAEPPVAPSAPPSQPWSQECPPGAEGQLERAKVGCKDNCEPLGTIFSCRDAEGKVHGPLWMTLGDGTPYALRARDHGQNTGRETLWREGRVHTDGLNNKGAHAGWWMFTVDVPPLILHASEGATTHPQVVALVAASPGQTQRMVADQLPGPERPLVKEALDANAIHEHAAEGWVEWRRYEAGKVIERAYSPRPPWADSVDTPDK